MLCKCNTVRQTTTTHVVNYKGNIIIIKNVPCYKCEKCGEVFFPASVAEKIESILERVGTIASKIFIFDYTNAA